jgi:hypothetical protein
MSTSGPRSAIPLLLAFLFACTAAPTQAATGRFLVISDIHFDPFADGSQFDRLRDDPIEQWGAILAGDRPPGFNPPGTDSNYALLASGLDDARRNEPDPDFILYPGDLLAHRWQARYDALAAEPHDADPRAYRDFTAKVVRFLAAEFRERFPTAPILPTLGNEDSFCGDYRIEPGGPFLSMFAEAWDPLLGNLADGSDFHQTFVRGGYYSVPLPGPPGHRLVVLNTVVFSVDYENACGSITRTPALDQLRWLSRTLARAEADGEAVWLLMHVPPGIDGFDSAEALERGESPVTFWQPELSSQFLRLVDRHRSSVRLAFAGHTHMDDFRVVVLESEPVLPCKIVPAISPIFGNNPGYQVYRYDRGTGEVQGYRTYFLPDFGDRRGSGAGEPARWALEYDSLEAFGLEALTARSVARLANRIGVDRAIRDRYGRYYDVSAAPAIPARTLDVYCCAIAHLGPDGLLACLGGASRPAGPRTAAPPAARD